MDSWTYDSAWPAEASSVGAARDFVASRLELHRLQEAVVHTQLVVSELATNAVRHAGTPFVVSLGHRDGVLTLAVQDSAAALPSLHPVDPAADGGRGLVMVSALSDSWGVTPCRDGGKEVWARFLIHAG